MEDKKSWKWEKVRLKIPYIKALKMTGATDGEIMEKLGISKLTFKKYMREHPEFKEALSFDRQTANAMVEEALLRLALGCTLKVKKAIKLKDSHYDERGKKVESERIEIVEEEEKISPSITAQTFWLKNRCPELWNEKSDGEEDNSEGFGVIEIPPARYGDGAVINE